MRILILIALAALLTGCVTKKRCADKFPPQSTVEYREVVVEKEVIKYRDTIIYVELDPIEVEKSVIIEVPVNLYVPPVEVFGNYSTARAWIAKQKLHIDLKEGGTLEIELKDAIKEVERLKELIKEEKKTEVIQVPYTPKVWLFLGWIGILALILLGLFIYRKFG